MGAQEIFRDARVAQVRELKSEIETLRQENACLREKCESIETHLRLAVAAVRDAEQAGADGRLMIVDGWNVVIGPCKLDDDRRHERRDELLAAMRRQTAADPNLRVWVVFDGDTPLTTEADRVRVTYTGGQGQHRADRLVCDYLRAAQLLGLKVPVTLITNDHGFTRQAAALGAEVLPVQTFFAPPYNLYVRTC